jgi:hypothetical protein
MTAAIASLGELKRSRAIYTENSAETVARADLRDREPKNGYHSEAGM